MYGASRYNVDEPPGGAIKPTADIPKTKHSPEYKDFLFGGTVTLCVGPKRKRMEIHKKLLASISPELNKHVNNHRRKDIKGIINLPDDREDVLTLFTEWAYTGDYAHKGIQLESPPGPEDPWQPLYNHLQLCVFAAKFNIPALGELAGSKFYTEINRIEPSSQRDATCLVMVIGYAYDNLPDFLEEFLLHLNGLNAKPMAPQNYSQHPQNQQQWQYASQYASQYEPQHEPQYASQYASQYESPMPTGYNGGDY